MVPMDFLDTIPHSLELSFLIYISIFFLERLSESSYVGEWKSGLEASTSVNLPFALVESR